MSLLLIISTIALAIFAKSKGYSLAAWTFGGGLIGICVMALLPNVSPIMGRQKEGDEKSRKRGNLIGCVLTGLTALAGIALFAFVAYAIYDPASD